MHQLIPFSTKAVWGAVTEPLPILEPVLCILTAKELAHGQENWVKSSTKLCWSGTDNHLRQGPEGGVIDQGPTKTLLGIFITREHILLTKSDFCKEE